MAEDEADEVRAMLFREWKGNQWRRPFLDERWEHDAYEANHTPDKRLRDEIIKLGEVVSTQRVSDSRRR